ncbi:hypothetical protein AALP_AA6G129000 [Arabis alpina]|uniref:Uncharacterized protein n=1 Tax=Arabis alpina TaxID=50452 RepID=A0A087GNW7_ARAAL|nr:hypothetical protein AALP_AA6G129000 [Arabis alpina]
MMTDERRIVNPKDAALRDLEDGDIQAEEAIPALLPQLLQKMDKRLDALLESAERLNKANMMITYELKSLGAEPGLFRKPAARLNLVALNFTTPVGPSSRPQQQPTSIAAKDGRSALLAQARREKAKVGYEPRDVNDDDEDLARRVVPDTELTESERTGRAMTKGRNNDPRQAALQQFSTLGDEGLAG